MTIQLTLPPETEQRILKSAEALNLPVEEYILSLVERTHPRVNRAPLADASDEDFIATLESLSSTPVPEHLRNRTWSRAEIYREHD